MLEKTHSIVPLARLKPDRVGGHETMLPPWQMKGEGQREKKRNPCHQPRSISSLIPELVTMAVPRPNEVLG